MWCTQHSSTSSMRWKKIQTFWGHVCTTTAEILGYTIPNNVMVLYFCVLNENVVIKKDWYLCKILLMACKKVII